MANSDTTAQEPQPSFIDMIWRGVQGPAREALPGILLSSALEVVYVIRCGDRAVLVDTGYDHTADAHLDNFIAAGVDPATIDAIFISHFHVDHAAGTARLRKRLGCPVVAHRNNVEPIEKGDVVVTAARMPYITGWDFPFPPCPVDEIVEDGDTITVGSTAFTVFHIPGHTPGCTAYLWDDNMVTGDAVFPFGALGWNDVHWGSNYHDVIDTMERVKAINPRHILLSHGGAIPYSSQISDACIATAKEIISKSWAGPMSQIARAPRAEPGRSARSICIRAK